MFPQTNKALIFWCFSCGFAGTGAAFQQQFTRPPLIWRSFAAQEENGGEALDNTRAKEMAEWILSLSLEPTDQSRRDRLADTFADKFNDNEFCDLFDEQLILLGDEIKQEAALQQGQQTTTTDDSGDNSKGGGGEESSSNDGGDILDEQLPIAKQLWAIVDLMIQKKTLVKRVREAPTQK